VGQIHVESRRCERFNLVLDSFGINGRKRGKMTDEALELIVQLWTSEAALSHQGEFYELVDLLVSPKPIQQPYPEVWYAGTAIDAGVAPGMRRAARYGKQLQLPWPSEREVRDILKPRLDEANREWSGNAELGLLLYAAVRPEGMPNLEESSQLYPHYGEVFLGTEGEVRNRGVDDEAGILLVGTPEQCAESIVRAHRAGTSHFILDFHRHGIDSTDVFRREMGRFAEQVFPLVV